MVVPGVHDGCSNCDIHAWQIACAPEQSPAAHERGQVDLHARLLQGTVVHHLTMPASACAAAVPLPGFSSACRLIQGRSTHAVAVAAGEMVMQVGLVLLTHAQL